MALVAVRLSGSSVLSSYKTNSLVVESFLNVSLALFWPVTISPTLTRPHASLRLLQRSEQLMLRAPAMWPKLKATKDRQSRRSRRPCWRILPANSTAEMVLAARAVMQSWHWSTLEAGEEDRCAAVLPTWLATDKLRFILSFSNKFSGTATNTDISLVISQSLLFVSESRSNPNHSVCEVGAEALNDVQLHSFATWFQVDDYLHGMCKVLFM